MAETEAREVVVWRPLSVACCEYLCYSWVILL